MTLQRESIKAMYVQIAEAIERKIGDGQYPPSSKLPSEQAMVAKYGASRVTVRQALGILLKKGLIESKQGKGTFVVGPVLQHGLDRLVGFYDSLVTQGQEPQTRLLEFRSATAAERARSVFPGNDLPAPVALKRLYLLEDRPFAIVYGMLTPDAAHVTRAQAEQLPIYRILGEILRTEVAHADVSIRARSVGRKDGALLKISPTRPVLVMERMSRDGAGRPLEHSWFHVLPEKYEVRLSVFGPLEISRGFRRVDRTNGRHRSDHVMTTAR